MAIFRYNNFRQVLSRNPCRLNRIRARPRRNDDSVRFNDSSKQRKNSSLSYQDRSQGWNLQSVNGCARHNLQRFMRQSCGECGC